MLWSREPVTSLNRGRSDEVRRAPATKRDRAIQTDHHHPPSLARQSVKQRRVVAMEDDRDELDACVYWPAAPPWRYKLMYTLYRRCMSTDVTVGQCLTTLVSAS